MNVNGVVPYKANCREQMTMSNGFKQVCTAAKERTAKIDALPDKLGGVFLLSDDSIRIAIRNPREPYSEKFYTLSPDGEVEIQFGLLRGRTETAKNEALVGVYDELKASLGDKKSIGFDHNLNELIDNDDKMAEAKKMASYADNIDSIVNN